MTTTTLPELTGTDKQQSYAADIRARALADHAARIEGARTKGVAPAILAEVQAKVDRMAAITDCRWWLDNGVLAAKDRLDRIDWVYRNATGTGCEWVRS